jgi:hypothetical protein
MVGKKIRLKFLKKVVNEVTIQILNRRLSRVVSFPSRIGSRRTLMKKILRLVGKSECSCTKEIRYFDQMWLYPKKEWKVYFSNKIDSPSKETTCFENHWLSATSLF